MLNRCTIQMLRPFEGVNFAAAVIIGRRAEVLKVLPDIPNHLETRIWPRAARLTPAGSNPPLAPRFARVSACFGRRWRYRQLRSAKVLFSRNRSHSPCKSLNHLKRPLNDRKLRRKSFLYRRLRSG